MLIFHRTVLALPLLALSGCSSGSSGYADYFQVVRQTFRHPFSSPEVTREQAAAVPYASMGYRINGSREALIVLATDTEGTLLWTSGSHVVLVTRDGRLQRSVGLPHDRGRQGFDGSTPVPAPAAALKGAVRYRRSEDFPDIGQYGVMLDCRMAPGGGATIRILQQPVATVRVTETCSAANLRWSFTDSFWLSPENGFAWRTQQHIHPNGDILETMILRPPG